MAQQATPEVVDREVEVVVDLTAIPRLTLSNGCRVWNRAAGVTNGLWCLNNQSVAVVDGLTVIATDDGVGRWIFFGGGGGGGATNIQVPNEAALTAFGVSVLKDGATAWVGDPAGGIGQSQGAQWTLVTQIGASPALDPHSVIASNAAGRVWQRQVLVVNQRWVQSTTWFVGGAAGNDENDGQTNVTPIATGLELARRMAGQFLAGGAVVTVTLLGAIPDDLIFHGVRAVILVQGSQTTVASDTLTAATAINRAVNQLQEVVAGAFNFTGRENQKIKLTSGAPGVIGAEAWIDFVSVDTHTIITSPFTTQPGGPLSAAVTVVSPAGDETFDIVTETTFRTLFMESLASSFSDLVVFLDQVTPTSQNGQARCGSLVANRVDMLGGIFDTLRFTGSIFASLLGCQTTRVAMADAASFSSAAGHSAGSAFGGRFIGNIDRTGAMQFSQDQLFGDSTVFPSAGSAQLDACAFRNVTNGRVAINCGTAPFAPASSVIVSTALYGDIAGINTAAILTSKYTTIDGGGITPTLTSTGANIVFGSAGLAWAGLPFVDQFDVGAGPVAGANMAGWL